MSWSLDDLPAFCDTGAWQDLSPYMEATDFDASVFPPSVARYTGFGGKAVRVPVPHGRARPVLQHGHPGGGRLHGATADDVRAHGDGEGPDGLQRRRLDRARGLRPVVRLLHDDPAGAGDHVRRGLLQRRRDLGHWVGPRLGRAVRVAEGPRRVLRRRQPAEVRRRTGRRVG